jgi:predicted MPP superfamily phosphohydrolase
MKLIFALSFAAFIILNMSAKQDKASVPSGNQKPLITFGIIADVQYSDYIPAGTRFYRSSLSKLRESMKILNENSVDFIINLGDLIDKDYNSYKTVLDIIDSSRLKTYHVAGNHDYAIDRRYKKRLPIFSSSKEQYSAFVYNNFRFILLNGNDVSTYISNNKSTIKQTEDYIATLKKNGEVNAVNWNGGIGIKQLEWLFGQLNEASIKNEKVFVMCHFPVVPENVHNLLNYKEVLHVLEKHHNIIAWFNGHNHAGNYGNFNRIHFVTFKGMVETETNNSFAIIEVYKNKIWIKGYGREKSQILAY